TNVVVSDSRTVLQATFNLVGTTPGARNVVISNPDGTSATLVGGFTVEQGGTPKILVDIIGRDKLRIGTPQTYYLSVNNTGNVDASNVAATIGVSIPTSVQVPDSAPLSDSYQSATVGQVQSFALPLISAESAQVIPFTLTTPEGVTGFSVRAQHQLLPTL